MATRLSGVLTYNEELSLIKLHVPSITWFCVVMLQIKYCISPLSLDYWAPNMQGSNFRGGLPTINLH